MIATVMLAIASVALVPSMSNSAFASSYEAYDRVKANSYYGDKLDICGQSNKVQYYIDPSNGERKVSWSSAPTTITCNGESVSLSKVVVVFEKHNTNNHDERIINNPQSTTSVTNNNDSSPYNKLTEITLTYS